MRGIHFFSLWGGLALLVAGLYIAADFTFGRKYLIDGDPVYVRRIQEKALGRVCDGLIYEKGFVYGWQDYSEAVLFSIDESVFSQDEFHALVRGLGYTDMSQFDFDPSFRELPEDFDSWFDVDGGVLCEFYHGYRCIEVYVIRDKKDRKYLYLNGDLLDSATRNSIWSKGVCDD